MTHYQKIAALILRLGSIGIIIYCFIYTTSLIFFMPKMIIALIPFLISGILLFLLAIPIAKLVTAGFDD